MRKLASVAIIFICFACEKTDKSQALQFNHNTAPIKIELPNTPETVVRAWEEKINKMVPVFISWSPSVNLAL